MFKHVLWLHFRVRNVQSICTHKVWFRNNEVSYTICLPDWFSTCIANWNLTCVTTTQIIICWPCIRDGHSWQVPLYRFPNTVDFFTYSNLLFKTCKNQDKNTSCTVYNFYEDSISPYFFFFFFFFFFCRVRAMTVEQEVSPQDFIIQLCNNRIRSSMKLGYMPRAAYMLPDIKGRSSVNEKPMGAFWSRLCIGTSQSTQGLYKVLSVGAKVLKALKSTTYL